MHVGPQGIVATREQFSDLGIPTYILPSDCVGKDNTAGSDGTRTALYSMDTLYQGITEPVSYTHLTLPTICSV